MIQDRIIDRHYIYANPVDRSRLLRLQSIQSFKYGEILHRVSDLRDDWRKCCFQSGGNQIFSKFLMISRDLLYYSIEKFLTALIPKNWIKFVRKFKE